MKRGLVSLILAGLFCLPLCTTAQPSKGEKVERLMYEKSPGNSLEIGIFHQEDGLSSYTAIAKYRGKIPILGEISGRRVYGALINQQGSLVDYWETIEERVGKEKNVKKRASSFVLYNGDIIIRRVEESEKGVKHKRKRTHLKKFENYDYLKDEHGDPLIFSPISFYLYMRDLEKPEKLDRRDVLISRTGKEITPYKIYVKRGKRRLLLQQNHPRQ